METAYSTATPANADGRNVSPNRTADEVCILSLGGYVYLTAKRLGEPCTFAKKPGNELAPCSNNCGCGPRCIADCPMVAKWTLSVSPSERSEARPSQMLAKSHGRQAACRASGFVQEKLSAHLGANDAQGDRACSAYALQTKLPISPVVSVFFLCAW